MVDFKKNEDLLRNIYTAGDFDRHAFINSPQLVGITDLPNYDYTISDKPVKEWVPWVINNYKLEIDRAHQVEDDAVPFAKLSTGTHIYAAAFADYYCVKLFKRR